MPGFSQNDRDSQHVVAPSSGASLREIIQVKCEMSGKLLGLDKQVAVLSGRHSNAGAKTNSAGHHKTLVVVGMFPNQIDATRRAEDGRAHPEQPSKLSSYLGRL